MLFCFCGYTVQCILYSKYATRFDSEILLDRKREPSHVPLPPGSAVFHVWSMMGAGSRDMLVWTLAPPHVPVPPAPSVISSSIPRCEWHISFPRRFLLFGCYNCCVITYFDDFFVNLILGCFFQDTLTDGIYFQDGRPVWLGTVLITLTFMVG